MKTLKKTLCMVLAVVMVVGVLILPASADDAADKAKAQEADYKTLTTYGIMHGRDGGAEALDEYVRRDEVATIVYRILTGDTSEDGKMAGNYKAAAKNFTDVATTNWAAGFIGYTAESKIFSGREGNKFDPTANVRGDELVKVMLRCLGYGEEGEYTGDGWNTRALYTAQEIGMLAGIDEQMDKPITRGAVSQIVANAIGLPMAVYYDGTYSIYHDNAGRPSAPNSGATMNAQLVKADMKGTGTVKYDEWGAPSRKDTPTVTFNHPNVAVTNKLDPVEGIKALATYTTAVTQCDLAEALGMEENKTFLTYTNGIENKTTTVVNPLNTTALIGAQGRYTAVYENPKFDKTKADSATNPTYILVYKDTLLAKVTEVKARTYDAAGHLKTPATMKLDVYDAVSPKAVTLTSKTADFTWTKGQYLLINYHQNDTVATNGNITAESEAVRIKGTATSWEKYQKYVTKTEVGRTASYEIEDWNEDGTSDINDWIKVLQEAPSFVGAQTLVSSNSDTHTIDKVVYNDNNRYYLDGAGKTMKVNFTWYQDTYGNVIGSSVINAANSFGVINKIYWTGSNGDGYVYAEVTYVDGTTDKLAVNMIAADVAAVSTKVDTNDTDAKIGIATNDYGVSGTMDFDNDKFYVNADAKVNAAADASANKIINNDLFRITASTKVPGTYDFVEVGGDGTNAEVTSTGNNKADFSNLGNDTTDMVSGRAKNGDVRVGSETVFLVRSGSKAPYTFTSYVGYGKIGDYVEGEVDYAYTDDEDTIADVVYITANAKGEQGWHLFFNTAVATKGSSYLVNVDDDGSNYIVHGILDGEAGTIKVKKTQQGWNGSSAYNGATLASAIASETNGNKLWMVYIKDGYVIDINGAAANGTAATDILKSVAETTDFQNAIVAFADVSNKGMLTASGYAYGSDPDELGTYEKLSAYTTVVTTDIEFEDDTIELPTSNVFSINGNVPLVGEWADLETASVAKDDGGYQVIIVCDKDGKVVESYIFPVKAVGTSTGTGSDPEEADPDALTVSVDGGTVTVNWHSTDLGGVKPTDEEIMTAVEAKLKALGYTTVVSSGNSTTGMTFKATVGGVTREFKLDSTGIVESIRIYVGKDGKTAKLVKTSAKVNEITVQGYSNNGYLYVYTELDGNAKTLTKLNNDTELKDGDIIYDDALYMKLTSGDPTVETTAITTGSPFSGSPSISGTIAYKSGSKLETGNYIKVGESYTLTVTLTDASATQTVKEKGTVTAELEFTSATNIKAFEKVTLLKEGDTVATTPGTGYDITFSVVLTGAPTADIAGIKVTLTGAVAA